METVVGIFTARSAGESAAERVRALGITNDQINLMIPGLPTAQLDSIPTTDAEQPGMGPVVGGVVGGVTGASGGLLGAAVASVLVPGVGPVMAIGLAAAAILGVGGAVAGAAAGSALENTLSEGLPKDELFIYEDALRQGRTVLIVLLDQEGQRDMVRDVLAQAGAESLDAAREHWWLGLRNAEAESYNAQGGDFSRDEVVYRRGFEAALHVETSGKTYGEALEYLRARHPEIYGEEAFRLGYVRGQAYRESLRKSHRG
jgi:hypothetical protein